MVKVKKANTIKFIQMCVEVSKAEAELQPDILSRAKAGDILTSDKGDDLLIGIKCTVRFLCEILTRKEEFSIIFDNGYEHFNSTKNERTKHRGTVKIYTESREITCPYGDLIEQFFKSISFYMEKRDITWKQLPLRLCEYCGTPFFGSRYDQRFCTTLHGGRWHAERHNARTRSKQTL